MATDLPDDLFLTQPDPGAEPTLSFSRSPTVLLSFAANRFTRLSSRELQGQFGIGAMDWRMLVMLTREPGSTVSHAARTIGIDKAAVSRSLRRLQGQGLAHPGAATGKDWHLTARGQALHARILPLALARQGRLLEGLSPQDVDTLTRCLNVFLDNLARLD